MLHPFNACTVTGLRLLSLVGAGINIMLLYKIRRRTLAGTGGNAYAAHEAITVSVLPPLYFFSHLYYTDTLSLTMVLIFYNYWQQDAHLPAAVFGAASVLMRQTNIVWVCMCCGMTILDTLVQQCAKTRPANQQQLRLFSTEVHIHTCDTHLYIHVFNFYFHFTALDAAVEQSSANMQLYFANISQVLLLFIDYIALYWIHLHQWFHRCGRQERPRGYTSFTTAVLFRHLCCRLWYI